MSDSSKVDITAIFIIYIEHADLSDIDLFWTKDTILKRGLNFNSHILHTHDV